MFDGAVYAFDTHGGRFTKITPVDPDPERGQTFGYAGVAVDASNPECVMVTTAYRGHVAGSGGDEIFRSLDGGGTWKAIGQAARRDHRRAPWLCFGHAEAHVGHWMYALVIDPFDGDKAYYGTGQTVWGTSNLGAVDRGERAEWIVQARGIEETVPLALVSPPVGAAVIAGTGDISGFAVFQGDDGDVEMVAMHAPTFKDTTSLDFAEHDPALVVRVGGRGWDRERDRDTAAFSINGGRTWTAFGAYPSEASHEGHVAVSADGRSWLWVPKNEPPVVSHDRSQTWHRPTGLPDGPMRFLSDRELPGVYYAFQRQGLGAFLSTDGGASFLPVSTRLPGSGLTDALAAGRAGHVWALFEQRLYRTTNGGAHWSEVSGLTRPSHIGIGKPLHDGYQTLFVVAQRGDKDGFFRSVDAGESFLRINDERHQFGQVRAIAGDPKRFGRLYVATGGRGVVYGDPSGDDVLR
jgi:photosystem II stability/assembly factor-like uncharacterized protein